MKTKTLLGCLCAALLIAGCAHHPVSAPPPAPAKTEPVKVSTRVNHWSTQWTPVFDGATLNNWAITDFAGHGPITVSSGELSIGMGDEMSGINWTNGTLPKTDYEISLEAKKVDGSDFFCGLTFPVDDSACSLILGGWGGGVVGLSSIDDMDASENETTKSMSFPPGKWFHIRVKVLPNKIQAWVDDEKMIDVSIAGRKVSLRPGPIFLSAPLGVAAYETSAALRDFKIRLVEH